MTFSAQIICDSVSPDGVRLTTFEATFPRYILAEVNTHRMLSRNSASSRAIPVMTYMARIEQDPYTPVYWGSNKKGMQAGTELNELERKLCLDEWLGARDDMMKRVRRLHELGLHKQDANRLLEPFAWHTALITATEWDNFFHLRNHPDAHPAFQTVAAMMQELYEELEPTRLEYGQWHLPLIQREERDHIDEMLGTYEEPSSVWSFWCKVSTGRCARVSYLTHEGKRDVNKDIELHDSLAERGHMSPFEHVARPVIRDDFDPEGPMADVPSDLDAPDPSEVWFGNFRGWVQYRKLIAHEHDPLGRSL